MSDIEERISKAADAMAGIKEEPVEEPKEPVEPETKEGEPQAAEPTPEPSVRKIIYEPDNSKWKALRKREKELSQKQRDLESRLALLDEDPEEFLRSLGKNPDEFTAKLTKSAIQNDDPVLREMKEIKRAVKAQQPQPEPQEEPDLDDYQERFLAAVQEAAADGYAIVMSDEGQASLMKLEDKWPSLAELHPMDRAMRIRGIVGEATVKAPNMKMEQVLDKLEEHASQWVKKVRGQESPRQPEPVNPEPAREPEDEAPEVRSAPEPEKIKRRPPSNGAYVDRDERIKRAARAAQRR